MPSAARSVTAGTAHALRRMRSSRSIRGLASRARLALARRGLDGLDPNPVRVVLERAARVDPDDLRSPHARQGLAGARCARHLLRDAACGRGAEKLRATGPAGRGTGARSPHARQGLAGPVSRDRNPGSGCRLGAWIPRRLRRPRSRGGGLGLASFVTEKKVGRRRVAPQDAATSLAVVLGFSNSSPPSRRWTILARSSARLPRSGGRRSHCRGPPRANTRPPGTRE